MHRMFRKLFETPNDPLIALIRLVVCVIFFMHGTQKGFGWFGGPGFVGTMQFFTAEPFTLALVGVMIPLPTSPGDRTNRGQTSSRTTS